jgi:hypothetical protein
VTKLAARGYELLDTGRYVLEVVEAEAVNEYGPQLRLKLRVAEGEQGVGCGSCLWLPWPQGTIKMATLTDKRTLAILILKTIRKPKNSAWISQMFKMATITK